MSDHVAAWIEIGGKITPTQAWALCQVIEQEHCYLGGPWDQDLQAIDLTPVQLRHMVNANEHKHLELHDAEARMPEFGDLENFLIGQGIPFDRHSEGTHAYTPEISRFRPDRVGDIGQVRPKAWITYVTVDDELFVTVATIRHWQALFLEGRVEELTRAFDDVLGDLEFEPLPAVEFVEEELIEEYAEDA